MKARDPENINIFFIIGRPRAGTTLLRTLFDAHPNITIPWECQYIVNLYSKYHRKTLWTEKELNEFYEDVIRQWQFRFWNVDFDKLREDLLSRKGEISYASLCKVVHSNFISFYDKKELLLLGDKNPGYTIYTEKLLKVFPDARFIYITRDYRDNLYSIKRIDFELPLASVVVYKWKYFLKQAMKAQRKHPEKVWIQSYEDLVSDPEPEMQKLCDFLNIPFEAEMLNFYERKDEVRQVMKTERAKKNHASLLHPISTKRIGMWKNHLSQPEVKMADFIARGYAERAGYEPKYKVFGLFTRIKAIPGITYARLLYLLTAIVNLFPYRLRSFVLSKGPLILARTYRALFFKAPPKKKP